MKNITCRLIFLFDDSFLFFFVVHWLRALRVSYQRKEFSRWTRLFSRSYLFEGLCPRTESESDSICSPRQIVRVESPDRGVATPFWGVSFSVWGWSSGSWPHLGGDTTHPTTPTHRLRPLSPSGGRDPTSEGTRPTWLPPPIASVLFLRLGVISWVVSSPRWGDDPPTRAASNAPSKRRNAARWNSMTSNRWRRRFIDRLSIVLFGFCVFFFQRAVADVVHQ